MQRWDSQSVDLIYLDPPFNSNAAYNVLYTDRGAGKAQYRAFDDTWHWDNAAEIRLGVYEGAGMRPARNAVLGLFRVLGPSGMMAYLTYMAERLEQMKRLLKPTGSIWLHCDPTANSYLRILMDSIFGANRLRNEIVWCYTGPGSPGMRQFNRKHDTIFWYARGRTWTFNRDDVRLPYKNPKQRPRAAFDTGGAFEEKAVREMRKRGKVPETWWAQEKGNGLCIAARSPKQNLGYPTQKPIALLDRIIKASSNEGDLILDPFCGCGTAVDAANRLGRQWAGVDISSFAIDLIRKRRMADEDIAVKGIPYDLQSARKLARDQPFNFESWAVTRLPGFAPNTRQVADGGVDGRATLATKPSDHPSRLALAQVKGGRFSLSHLRDFRSVQERDKAAVGVYLTLHPVTSQNAKVEAGKARTVTVGAEQYRRCQLWSIAEHFDDRRPHLPTMTDPYTGKPIVQQEMFA
jgi:DNA modification methylase